MPEEKKIVIIQFSRPYPVEIMNFPTLVFRERPTQLRMNLYCEAVAISLEDCTLARTA